MIKQAQTCHTLVHKTHTNISNTRTLSTAQQRPRQTCSGHVGAHNVAQKHGQQSQPNGSPRHSIVHRCTSESACATLQSSLEPSSPGLTRNSKALANAVPAPRLPYWSQRCTLLASLILHAVRMPPAPDVSPQSLLHQCDASQSAPSKHA